MLEMRMSQFQETLRFMASAVEQMMHDKIEALVACDEKIDRKDIDEGETKIDNDEIEIDDIYINLLVEVRVKKTRNRQRQSPDASCKIRHKRQAKFPKKLRLQSTSVIPRKAIGTKDSEEYSDESY